MRLGFPWHRENKFLLCFLNPLNALASGPFTRGWAPAEECKIIAKTLTQFLTHSRCLSCYWVWPWSQKSVFYVCPTLVPSVNKSGALTQFRSECRKAKQRPDLPNASNKIREIPPVSGRAETRWQQANRASKQNAWFNLTSVLLIALNKCRYCLECAGWKMYKCCAYPIQIFLTCSLSVVILINLYSSLSVLLFFAT